MIKISKIDAFDLIIEALENGDEKTANEILKIIQDSIEKEDSRFSENINVNKKKDKKYFKKIIEEQS